MKKRGRVDKTPKAKEQEKSRGREQSKKAKAKEIHSPEEDIRGVYVIWRVR